MTSGSWKARKVVIVGAGGVEDYADVLFARNVAIGKLNAMRLLRGVERIVESNLSDEHKSLSQSALVLKDTLAKLR